MGLRGENGLGTQPRLVTGLRRGIGAAERAGGTARSSCGAEQNPPSMASGAWPWVRGPETSREPCVCPSLYCPHPTSPSSPIHKAQRGRRPRTQPPHIPEPRGPGPVPSSVLPGVGAVPPASRAGVKGSRGRLLAAKLLDLLGRGGVGQQHLHRVAHPLGVDVAVGVVEAQDVCGMRWGGLGRQGWGPCVFGVGLGPDSQMPGVEQVREPSSGTMCAL